MMDKLDREQLYNTAWKHWGSDTQLDMLIEEMAELTQAILKTRRTGVRFSYAVYEEIADVSICMEQVETQLKAYPRTGKYHTGEDNGFDWDTVISIRDRKLERLKERLMQSMTAKHGGEEMRPMCDREGCTNPSSHCYEWDRRMVNLCEKHWKEMVKDMLEDEQCPSIKP